MYYNNRFQVSPEAFLSSIVLIGHPALRAAARPLPSAWIRSGTARNLVKKMLSIMRGAEGVGLAANQIGLPYRLFVMECLDSPRVPGRDGTLQSAWFNPRILKREGRRVLDWEGCLSIPGYQGLTPRSEKIVFEAVGLDGRKVRREVRGFEARVLQHETDHLDGMFYVDRMNGLKSWTHVDELNRRSGEDRPLRKSSAGKNRSLR
jgi:peptide deformylase